MSNLSHDVIAGMDWLWHNRPYIDWDTLVITLKRNGVSFQVYPAKMNCLLQATVFVRLTKIGEYEFKGGRLDFWQCSMEVIYPEVPSNSSCHNTQPPKLKALLVNFADIFCETLDILPPPVPYNTRCNCRGRCQRPAPYMGSHQRRRTL